ncbi:hypothetical protein ACI8OL_004704 [Salmonella enterica]
MSMKILGKNTTASVVSRTKTTSGKQAGLGDAEYYNAILDASFFAPTPDQVLNDMEENGIAIVDQQEIQKEIKAGNIGGKINITNDIEYETVVIDLSNYKQNQLQDVYDIIKNRLKHPDFKVTKNQGGGRFTDYDLTDSNRSILAYPIHQEQNANAHVHIDVGNRIFKNGAVITKKVELTENIFAEAQLERINQDLVAAGFAPLTGFATQAQSLNKKVNPALATNITQQVNNAITNNTPVEAPEVQAPANLASQKNLIQEALNEAEKRAQEHLLKATIEAQNAGLLKKAIDAIDTQEKLEANITDLNSTISELNGKVITIESELKEAQEKGDELEKQLVAEKTKSTDLEESVNKLNEELDSLNESLDSLSEKNKELTEENTLLDTELSETKEQVRLVNKALEDEQQKVINLNEEIKNEQEKTAKIEQELETVKESNISLTETNSKLLESNNMLSKEVQDLKDKLAQVNTELAVKENDIKNKVEMIDTLKEQNKSQKETMDQFRKDFESKIKEFEQKITKFETENSSLKEENKDLKEAAETLVETNESLIKQVEEAKKHENKNTPKNK